MDRISIYIWNKFRWARMNFWYGWHLCVILTFLLAISLFAVGFLFNCLEVLEFFPEYTSSHRTYIIAAYFSTIIFFIVYYLTFTYFRFYRAGTIYYSVIAAIALIAIWSINRWLDKLFLEPHLLPIPWLLVKVAYMPLFLVFAFFAIPFMLRVHQSMVGGHRITTRFERAHSAIEKLAETKNAPIIIRAYQVLCHNRRNILCSLILNLMGKSIETKNDEIESYKSMYDIYPFSCAYDGGIEEIKKLLMRGVNLNGFSISISNTKLNLNELLDQLSLLTRYYLFYGETEQMEAVKTHMVRMTKCFDENYNIHVDEFVNEVSRMYNEMNIFFEERNIDIIDPTTLVDRIINHLSKIIPLVVLSIICIVIKNFIPQFQF